MSHIGPFVSKGLLVATGVMARSALPGHLHLPPCSSHWSEHSPKRIPQLWVVRSASCSAPAVHGFAFPQILVNVTLYPQSALPGRFIFHIPHLPVIVRGWCCPRHRDLIQPECLLSALPSQSRHQGAQLERLSTSGLAVSQWYSFVFQEPTTRMARRPIDNATCPNFGDGQTLTFCTDAL